MKVFVYGTLRSGDRAADLLDQYDGVTRVGGTMSSLYMYLTIPPHGAFPAVVNFDDNSIRENLRAISKSRCVVVGEVVSIPSAIADEVLERLDGYEGYPSLYDRTRVMVVDDDGRHHECLMYFMPYEPDYMGDYNCMPTGDWCNRDEPGPTLDEVQNSEARDRIPGLAEARGYFRASPIYRTIDMADEEVPE